MEKLIQQYERALSEYKNLTDQLFTATKEYTDESYALEEATARAISNGQIDGKNEKERNSQLFYFTEHHQRAVNDSRLAKVKLELELDFKRRELSMYEAILRGSN